MNAALSFERFGSVRTPRERNETRTGWFAWHSHVLLATPLSGARNFRWTFKTSGGFLKRQYWWTIHTRQRRQFLPVAFRLMTGTWLFNLPVPSKSCDLKLTGSARQESVVECIAKPTIHPFHAGFWWRAAMHFPKTLSRLGPRLQVPCTVLEHGTTRPEGLFWASVVRTLLVS